MNFLTLTILVEYVEYEKKIVSIQLLYLKNCFVPMMSIVNIL